MPIVKLFSVNIKNNRREFDCINTCLIRIIEELENSIPGIKKELLDNRKLNISYKVMIEEEINNEKKVRCIERLTEKVQKNARIFIFPVSTGG